MNELEAWETFILEWKQVKRMKRLNQELYDLLGGAIVHTLEHSKRHSIPIPNREGIYRMTDRIHALMDEINQQSDELLHREASDGDVPESTHNKFIY